MPFVRRTFSNGLVTSRDRALLRDGELQQCTNGYYKPGDNSRVYNMNGEAAFGDTGDDAAVGFVGLALYDSGGTDRLLSYIPSTGKVYSATPGTTGTFSSLITGLNTSASRAALAHFLDRHVLCNGYDRNRVIKADGTVYNHGMLSPQVQPAGTPASTAGTNNFVDNITASTGWTNPSNVSDADVETFAGATLSAAGSVVLTANWDAFVASSHNLWLKWGLAGLQEFTETPEGGGGGNFGIGGTIKSGFNVTIKVEHTVDGNAATPTWTTDLEVTRESVSPEVQFLQVPIANASYNNADVQFRITFTYNSGVNPATMRVYYENVLAGSTASNFSTTTGLYYAVSEYDATNERESAPGPTSELVTLSTQNNVSLSLPSAAQNSETTHWRVYRTTDGGVTPAGLGRIGEVPVTETAFLDTFEKWDANTLARPLVNLKTIESGGGTIRVYRDTPPPSFQHVSLFNGRIIGITRDFPRTLYYSEAGAYESFPEINVITSWPFEEHDELVASVQVGDVLLLGSKGLMMTMSDVPDVVQGVWNAAAVEPLRGQPGLVGQYALTAFSVAGEPRAAWVSRFGVHVTNGAQAWRISDDLEWDTAVAQENLSSAVLHYDQQNQVLVLACNSRSAADSSPAVTTNDVEYWFHISPEHLKEATRPRITTAARNTHHMTSGILADGNYRSFSADPSDGTVALWEGGTGAALTIKTGRLYSRWDLWMLVKGSLRTHNWSSGDEAVVSVLSGRDAPGTTQLVTRTVDLTKTDEFSVARSGEWFEVTVVCPSGSRGAVVDLRMDVEQMGEAGGLDAA